MLSYSLALKLYIRYQQWIEEREKKYSETALVIPLPDWLQTELRYTVNKALFDLAYDSFHGEDPNLTPHRCRSLRDKIKLIASGPSDDDEQPAIILSPQQAQPAPKILTAKK